MIIRAHHTLVDGISGIRLLEDFCDRSTLARERGARARTRWHNGYLGWLKALAELPVAVPLATAGTIRALAPVLYSAIAPTAEPSLNGTIGQQRRYAVARAELPQVQEICRALGVTVNDVAVAAITAGYRRLLLPRGEIPESGELRVVIPVSTRAADAKQVPAGVVANVFRVAFHLPQRAIGTLATNIPGPRHRLTLGGRETVELWPCIPTALRLWTTIAILSYRDRLTFGITADT